MTGKAWKRKAHTKTLITEGTMDCTKHYHWSTNVFISWTATTFIHWDSGYYKNSIETHLKHMNVLSERHNEEMKSLENGRKQN